MDFVAVVIGYNFIVKKTFLVLTKALSDYCQFAKKTGVKLSIPLSITNRSQG